VNRRYWADEDRPNNRRKKDGECQETKYGKGSFTHNVESRTCAPARANPLTEASRDEETESSARLNEKVYAAEDYSDYDENACKYLHSVPNA
jgi:hypothetical protein